MIRSRELEEFDPEVFLPGPSDGGEFNDQCVGGIGQEQAHSQIATLQHSPVAFHETSSWRQVVYKAFSDKEGAGEHDRTDDSQAVSRPLKYENRFG